LAAREKISKRGGGVPATATNWTLNERYKSWSPISFLRGGKLPAARKGRAWGRFLANSALEIVRTSKSKTAQISKGGVRDGAANALQPIAMQEFVTKERHRKSRDPVRKIPRRNMAPVVQTSLFSKAVHAP